MPKSFLLIILSLITTLANAQKDGYEVIRMGKNFFDNSISDDYEQSFSTLDSLTFRIQPKAAKFICKEAIDYLNVKINRDSTISQIELFTVARIYQNNNDFLNNYRTISACLVGDFGKPDYLDDGRNKKDGLTTAAWYFSDMGLMFIIYAYNLPFQPNNAKRFYKMVWRPYDPREQYKIQ